MGEGGAKQRMSGVFEKLALKRTLLQAPLTRHTTCIGLSHKGRGEKHGINGVIFDLRNNVSRSEREEISLFLACKTLS